MSDTIPYTHWAHFADEAAARRCANELPDCVIRIQKAVDEAPLGWLLLAGRDVEIGGLRQRHDEVEEVVTRHGGQYDFGEATYNTATGNAVADPMLTGNWDNE